MCGPSYDSNPAAPVAVEPVVLPIRPVLTFSLDDQDDYDIACAMRGPDAGHEIGATYSDADLSNDVKRISTAVLRNFIGTSKWGGWQRTPEQAREVWNNMSAERKAAVQSFYNTNDHWAHHLASGFSSLSSKLFRAADANPDQRAGILLYQKEVESYRAEMLKMLRGW